MCFSPDWNHVFAIEHEEKYFWFRSVNNWMEYIQMCRIGFILINEMTEKKFNVSIFRYNIFFVYGMIHLKLQFFKDQTVECVKISIGHSSARILDLCVSWLFIILILIRCVHFTFSPLKLIQTYLIMFNLWYKYTLCRDLYYYKITTCDFLWKFICLAFMDFFRVHTQASSNAQFLKELNFVFISGLKYSYYTPPTNYCLWGM